MLHGVQSIVALITERPIALACNVARALACNVARARATCIPMLVFTPKLLF